MEEYKKEGLQYLFKLEKLCRWLEFEKNKSSFAGFVKEGIITRGELRDKKFLSIRRDIVYWGNQGWTRGRDWKETLRSRIKEFKELE